MTIDELGARSAPPSRDRSPRWQVVLEIVASVMAVDASVLILLNYLKAHVTFFGAPVHVDAQQVQHYWALVAVLTVAALVSVSAAVRRRARRALAWHLAIAAVGVLVALTFPVTHVGLVQDEPDPGRSERPEDPGTSACHSGGDSDKCLGG
jgi:hypothetical protein